MHQPGSAGAVSFEEQFRLHYKFLCTVAYYVVEDKSAAMDIVQDFFLYCWSKREVLHVQYDFKSYAVRAVRNASLNYIKRTGKTSMHDLEAMDELVKHFPAEAAAEEDNRNAALWSAISRLPEQRRKIFLLSNRDGLKYMEIADTLGISINTVKTQVRLALQFLRQECKWMIKAGLLVFLFKILAAFTLFVNCLPL